MYPSEAIKSETLNWSRPETLLNFGSSHRLPVILQAETAECGLVCLAMVAAYHGYNTDIVSLRQRFAVSSHGTNLKAIINTAGRMHFASRAIRLEVEQLNQLQRPAILHWDLNHFVVLKEVKQRYLIIHDPAVGERKMKSVEFAEHFTGVALELTPTGDFEAVEIKQTLKLNQFWTHIIGFKLSMLQVLLLALLLQLFAVISPYYMQTVVDNVLLRNDDNLLLVLALGFGLLLIIRTGTNTLREFVVIHLSNRLSIQMAANLFRHLIRLPMDYFYKRHMGDIISRFGSLNTIQNLLTTGLITAIVDGVMVLITLMVMFFYSIRLTLIVLTAMVLYAFLRFTLYSPLRLLTEEGIIAKAKVDSHFMESIRAIQTIKLFQRENDRQSQWHNYMADSMNKGIRMSKWNVGYGVLNSLLTGMENLVVIYFAALAIMGNLMSIGMFYAFMSYKDRFESSITSLIGKWIELKILGLHMDRLADIAFTPIEAVDNNINTTLIEQDRNTSARVEILHGRIEVRDLSFRYSTLDVPVFSNLNFVVEAGENVAITGPSGCGKTTLIKCLMGLLTPTEGEILIDGQPFHILRHYRSQIAGIMQDDKLMSGTISDNIACFAHKIDIDRVHTCARQACIHHEISSMPMQYNTLVGDMGTSLSGGQYQRVVLARALYRGPRILFMDEATSHLDVIAEAAINHHIKQLAITRIIVAHRPETTRSADRQINMVSGNTQLLSGVSVISN